RQANHAARPARRVKRERGRGPRAERCEEQRTARELELEGSLRPATPRGALARRDAAGGFQLDTAALPACSALPGEPAAHVVARHGVARVTKHLAAAVIA